MAHNYYMRVTTDISFKGFYIKLTNLFFQLLIVTKKKD